MAKCTVSAVKYTPPRIFQLELDEEEAALVFSLVGSVIGSKAGPRGVSDRIWGALEASGLDYTQIVPSIKL